MVQGGSFGARVGSDPEGRPISLHIEAEGHPTILGSPAQLRELLTNLIFNAVDALPEGGTISLGVVADDEQGILEVSDTGVGMSAESSSGYSSRSSRPKARLAPAWV